MIGLCIFGINFVVLSLIGLLISFILYMWKSIWVDPNKLFRDVFFISYVISLIIAKYYGI